MTQPGETGPNSSVEPGSPTNSNSPLPSAPSPTSPIPTPGPASQPGDLLSPRPTTPAGPQGRANPPGSPKIFQFDDVENPTDVRVIRVPIDQLRQYGELKYNIVIRPSDMIIVPDPTTGVYYFGGHVFRAGVFSLSGTEVTLKQAWIAAGGADDFAFPNRTEVIRRIGSNREVCVRVDLSKILALSEPDIYLKPNDVVFVGTHFIAPFVAAVRNSFRFTYGFGFLYDRNFYNGPNGF